MKRYAVTIVIEVAAEDMEDAVAQIDVARHDTKTQTGRIALVEEQTPDGWAEAYAGFARQTWLKNVAEIAKNQMTNDEEV